jgi:hypothetical protein
MKPAFSIAPSRRSFLKTMAAASGASLLPGLPVLSAPMGPNHLGNITNGDAAILRFLAAAEILETDAWNQYNDFASAGGPYSEALEVIDEDMAEYVEENTEDEQSHMTFLNALLVKLGRKPVDLERFRTLPSSPADPTQQNRLTNLMHLNVDTSWYTRYRTDSNPDFGDQAAQVVTINNRPAIPTQAQNMYTANQIQAIANTAAFHFAMIEQGGSSVYDVLSMKCNHLLAQRVVTSIGGSEVAHFTIWNDTITGVPAVDSGDGLVFPDLETIDGVDPEQVMPKPCKFISADLPPCAIIRPTGPAIAGAQAAVQFFTQTGLFVGQSQAFFDFFMGLARQADAAMPL